MKIADFSEAVNPLPYHDTLNPKLWSGDKLKPEIRATLLKIARHFAEYLEVPDLKIKDITVSGSNAAYGYSDHSDLDLHLIVDIPKDHPDLAVLFDAKKNLYNSQHDIQIKNIDVELYVQDSKQEHYSAGIYSVYHDRWLVKPEHEHISVTHKEIKAKARNYSAKINRALKSKDLNIVNKTLKEIKKLRQAGLERNGEFSVENLAYKLLRARGQIDKLRKLKEKLESAELSLKEKT